MSLQYATTASSSIDPAAPATLISPSNNPSPIHTPPIHLEPGPTPASETFMGSSSSSSLAAHTERIPKLSATTAEILARVNGNIKDTNQGVDIAETANSTPADNENSSLEPSNPATEIMKDPSTTTVTFPVIHMAEPKNQTPTPIMKSESGLPSPSPSTQIKLKRGSVKAILPKAIQPKGTPLPATAGTPSTSSASKRQKTAVRRGNSSAKRGKKRKRGKKNEDDDSDSEGGGSSSDESSGLTPIATQTKSGRQIHRPALFAPAPKAPTPSPDVQPARKRRRVYRKGKETNVTCNHCQRGHSPTSNVIVFCDECNGAWHQFCHDPPIENEVIQVKEAEWFCRECRPVSNESVKPADIATVFPDAKPPEKIDKPLCIPFATKVGGGQFSSAEKHAYLTRLSHTALVNLLTDIASSNPSLPMFPSNLSQSHIPSNILADSATSTPLTSMTTNLSSTSTGSVSTAPTNTSNNTPPIVISGPPSSREVGVEDDEYEYVEEHRLYPRAGNGFRLPPESEDLDMLLEDPQCSTFSHSLHGPAKARAEAARMVGVGGVA